MIANDDNNTQQSHTITSSTNLRECSRPRGIRSSWTSSANCADLVSLSWNDPVPACRTLHHTTLWHVLLMFAYVCLLTVHVVWFVMICRRVWVLMSLSTAGQIEHDWARISWTRFLFVGRREFRLCCFCVVLFVKKSPWLSHEALSDTKWHWSTIVTNCLCQYKFHQW